MIHNLNLGVLLAFCCVKSKLGINLQQMGGI